MSALSKKIFLALLISFLFFFIFPRISLANCPLEKCYGDHGECAESVVKNCVIGVNPPYEAKKCTNGNWANTNETPLPGIEGCTITIMGQTAGSLKKYQEKIDLEYLNKTIGLEGFSTGQDILHPGAPSGIMSNLLYGAASILMDRVPIPGQAYRPGGAIGATSGLIASLYSQPPASGFEYLADLGQNFGLVSPAYAQGIGFKGLSPILKLWKAFRNMAYLMFVIVFIVMGLAIMFRMKISPQAVLTLESALPKIIIALILVTFSYAISGFLIDLIYIILTILIAILGQAGLLTNIATIQQNYLSGGFINVVGALFGGTLRSFDDVAKLLIPSAEVAVAGTVVGAIIGGLIGPGGAIVGAVVGLLGGGTVATILVMLILLITVLYILFKLFFMLLTAYISIILSIIFAPFMIMLGVLPGQKGFGDWFKTMLSNILVFPAVAGMLLIGTILTSSNVQDLWTPPLMGMGTIGNAVTGLIGLGMLLMTPQVAQKIKDVFGFKPQKGGLDFGPLTWITGAVGQQAQKQFGTYALGGSFRDLGAEGLRSDLGRIAAWGRDRTAARRATAPPLADETPEEYYVRTNPVQQPRRRPPPSNT